GHAPEGTTMPRGDVPEHWRHTLENRRLFSNVTRLYLRRRAWRYFRRLGKKKPERYIPAVTTALKLYQEQNSKDGLPLIEHSGLIHSLFHRSPALVARRHGWATDYGHTLAELEAAPIYEHLWKAVPSVFLDLLRNARCRPVRHWAVCMIRRDMTAVLG